MRTLSVSWYQRVDFVPEPPPSQLPSGYAMRDDHISPLRPQFVVYASCPGAKGAPGSPPIFPNKYPYAPLMIRCFLFRLRDFKFSFAMTINKVQGWTIPHASVYLSELVFSHDQLYVAKSRAIARSSIKVLVVVDKDKTPPPPKKNKRQDKGTLRVELDIH